MHKNSKMTPEQIVYIKEKLTEGNTYQSIANTVGLSKERVRQYARKWKLFPMQTRQEKRNKELFIKYQAKYGNHKDVTPSDLYDAQRQKFNRKRANSIKNGYSWNINFGDINWSLTCPILNLELDYFAEFRQENSVSFDRIDSNLGYIPGNVQIVSWRANRIKNDGTAEEHCQIAEYLDKIKHGSL